MATPAPKPDQDVFSEPCIRALIRAHPFSGHLPVHIEQALQLERLGLAASRCRYGGGHYLTELGWTYHAELWNLQRFALQGYSVARLARVFHVPPDTIRERLRIMIAPSAVPSDS